MKEQQTIQMAIIGYETEIAKMQATVDGLRAQLRGSIAAAPKAANGRKKREMSAEGRARIAAAQAKRWAEARKAAKKASAAA